MTYEKFTTSQIVCMAVPMAAAASCWARCPDRNLRGGCYLFGSFDKGAVFKTARSREGAGFAR